MDKLVIHGGARLSGEIRVSGAKNAALPLMCAALLTEDELTLSNVPHLRDVSTMVRLLSQMGVEASLDDKLGLSLRAARISNPTAPYDLVKTMRASILVLGPLVARWARPGYRFREAAPSGRAPSIVTSRGSRRWARRSRWSRGTSRRRRSA